MKYLKGVKYLPQVWAILNTVEKLDRIMATPLPPREWVDDEVLGVRVPIKHREAVERARMSSQTNSDGTLRDSQTQDLHILSPYCGAEYLCAKCPLLRNAESILTRVCDGFVSWDWRGRRNAIITHFVSRNPAEI